LISINYKAMTGWTYAEIPFKFKYIVAVVTILRNNRY